LATTTAIVRQAEQVHGQQHVLRSTTASDVPIINAIQAAAQSSQAHHQKKRSNSGSYGWCGRTPRHERYHAQHVALQNLQD
jgi:hypothetical protein